MSDKTIDSNKAREMRRMLASEGGADKVRQRYGDQALNSPEFRLATKQNAKVQERQKRLAKEGPAIDKDRTDSRDEERGRNKDSQDDVKDRQRDAERDKKARQHHDKGRDDDRGRSR